MIKYLILFSFLFSFSNALIKDKNSNDVYCEALILQNKIVHLADEKSINPKYLNPHKVTNKSPRHVFQKAIEVLQKINKYRQNTNLGEISIPSFPSTKITSEDVYFQIVRLNKELDILLNNVFCPHIKALSIKKTYTNKTSNDNYFILWKASLAMDELLGRGFSPTDNYEQSVLVLDIINFLRNSQNIYEDIEKPKKKKRKHPNHVLYATNNLLNKIAKVEKRLWIEPVDVPSNPQRIINPTEVYDSLQTVVTELKRIRKRLGLERLYEVKTVEDVKTPSDVLQNVEYAIKIFPEFKLSDNLKQYDKTSLKKTKNELYALSVFILNKINYLKNYKGIKLESNSVPYIYNLTAMHVYQKSIETIEKINKIRVLNGLHYIATPQYPIKTKDENYIYNMLLMIDDDISIIMKKNGVKNIKKWSFLLDKKSYSNKNYSDIYYNLWKITSVIDTLIGKEYTSNEIYILAKELEDRVLAIYNHLAVKKINLKYKKNQNIQFEDIFNISLNIYKNITKILERANISGGTVIIPKATNITSDTVYNSLRVINASLIDLNIHFGIEVQSKDVNIKNIDKTPFDVYDIMLNLLNITTSLLEDSSYEN